LERSILEINDYEPTSVVVSGDLTDAGYRQEFEQAPSTWGISGART
jgi:hypothetical protein